jgi:predicted glycoside hydrolase/deacetylase ChbG (UPF0249 family)
MAARKLIVNADDFGQSEGVNKGIIQSFERGILTSASLMVRYPAAGSAAEYAKANPSLCVGLHVDLGEWIYSNGEWEPLYEVVSLDDSNAVKLEIESQVDAFVRLMNRKPAHIDSHQHVHQRKHLLPVFLQIAQRLNVPLRNSGNRILYCGDFYGQLHNGVPYHEAISVSGLEKTISGLPYGVTELACHPGLDSDVPTMYRDERSIEVTTLCHPKIRERIAAENIELTSFEHLHS